MDLKVIVGPACSETMKEDIKKRIQEMSGKPFDLTSYKVHKFKDGEILPQIQGNVRGADVYIVQPTNQPEENFKCLKLFLSAATSASAGRVTAVLPYFGGSRQDRKDRPRVSITAKDNAKEIELAMGGASERHVMIFHPHFSQIQGFFDIPSDLLYPTDIFIKTLKEMVGDKLTRVVPAAPDIGAAKMADVYAKRFNIDEVAVGIKRRGKDDKVIIRAVTGNVRNKIVVVYDDIIDTANTIKQLAFKLKEEGIAKIYVFATHGIFAKGAIKNLYEAKSKAGVEKVVITDSIKHKRLPSNFITVVRSGGLIGEAIFRNHTGQSLSDIYGMF